jgi:tetratricopeptide (TPR) repeat protein
MGGDATFAGTTYQARLIVYVYAHIIAQMRLGWVPPYDDTPIAVAGETNGPGDDARIEFGGRLGAVEVQAKHGLTGGAKLDEVIERIRSHSNSSSNMRVVLAVDSTSSRTVTREFAGDLERFRSGRRDGLKAEITRILANLGGDAAPLQRLSVAVIDVDRTHDPGAKIALHLLSSVLENPEQAFAALGVLGSDADEVCARRLHRTRKDLVAVLTEAKLAVRPPARDERWHRQLDFSKRLLEKHYASAALIALKQLGAELGDTKTEPFVRFRLAQQTAVAQLQLGRFDHAYQSARRALDIDPIGLPALTIAVFAALKQGEVNTAKTLAQRALDAHPHDPQSWGLQVHIAIANGEPIREPPSGVSASSHYRTVLAETATEAGDWARAIELTQSLIAEESQQPMLLLLRANALLSAPPPLLVEERERAQEAERLCTSAIELFGDETHPHMTYALVLRASARRRLGKKQETETDLARARELDSSDPNAIDHTVRLRIQEGNEDAALELLRLPAVEKVPELVALRAQIHGLRNNPEAARQDIEAALGIISSSADTDKVRLLAAEAALVLKDHELAKRLLSSVSVDGQQGSVFAVLRGRIEFLNENPTQAEAYYREAAARYNEHRSEILAELGSKLLRRRDVSGGVRVLNELGVAHMPSPVIRDYASALLDTGDLPRAQQLVDLLAARGPLPDWALSLATNIALRQENTDAAVSHLEELVGRGRQTPHTRIVLTRLLLESERAEDAHRHADALTSEQTLTSNERMQVAHLLLQVGRPKEALALAFRAFREATHDPKIHRAFISLILLRDTPREQADMVGPDTHVKLRGDSGETLERTILASPPFDRLLGQIDLVDAEASGYLGKRVGDTIIKGRAGWNEKRWVVEEIVPAVVHAARDAMVHYEERFPREPFFMTSFSLGDISSVRAFAPLIASIEARKAHINQVQALYREQILPLNLVANMLGATVGELMQDLTVTPSKFGPLVVEWVDTAGQQQSRLAALQATEVVLTRSALQTAFSFHLLERLKAFNLVAPLSLLRELRDEERNAEKLVSKGQTMLMGGERGLTIQTLEPSDRHLVERLESIRTQLQWVEASVRIAARPLATIHPIGSSEEELRDLIGHSSADAVALVKHFNSTLYADDLGLRRILAETAGTEADRSFSTITLLPSLTERDLISADERDRLLLSLVDRNYVTVPPSVELLIAALRRISELGWTTIRRVFALLGSPGTTATEVARISAQVMKKLVTSPIHVIDFERVVELVLDGLHTRWPTPLCAHLVKTAASDELALLPQYLDVVRRVCTEFSRQGRFPH